MTLSLRVCSPCIICHMDMACLLDDDSDDGDNLTCMSLMTPSLQGIGPATASAALAAFNPACPFFSDEAGASALVGGQQLKYSLPEYLRLADSLQSRAADLSKAAGELAKSGLVDASDILSRADLHLLMFWGLFCSRACPQLDRKRCGAGAVVTHGSGQSLGKDSKEGQKQCCERQSTDCRQGWKANGRCSCGIGSARWKRQTEAVLMLSTSEQARSQRGPFVIGESFLYLPVGQHCPVGVVNPWCRVHKGFRVSQLS